MRGPQFLWNLQATVRLRATVRLPLLYPHDAQPLEAVEVAILGDQPGNTALAADRDDLGVEDEIAYGVCLSNRFRQKGRIFSSRTKHRHAW